MIVCLCDHQPHVSEATEKKEEEKREMVLVEDESIVVN